MSATAAKPRLSKGLHKQHTTKPGWVKVAPDGAEGVVEVAFAQLEVVDSDGDYTIPGAAPVGGGLKVCQWGHAWHSPPAGKGVISGEVVDPDGRKWIVARLEYFLDTPHGESEYRTVKGLGDLCEWSYGYDVLDAEYAEVDGRRVQVLKGLNIFEVSPVLRGAGVDTHTRSVKTADGTDVCTSCGQAMPKEDPPADPPAEGDDDAEAPTDDAAAQGDDAKGRTPDVAVAFIANQARILGVPIE